MPDAVDPAETAAQCASVGTFADHRSPADPISYRCERDLDAPEHLVLGHIAHVEHHDPDEVVAAGTFVWFD